jgi:hypothetical protein
MSGGPSFKRFDYLLRTNKHIERKLVFDVLHAAARRIGLATHWYLGFGSMWFGDFRLAHRMLDINDLVSIEREAFAARAAFNKPYSGIVVEAGECTAVLDRLGEERWNRPLIAWMDYDGHVTRDVAANLRTILGKAQPHSVVVATVNAVRGTYRVRGTTGERREETSVGVVEELLGAGTVDAKFAPTQNRAGVYLDVSEKLFPRALAEALLVFLASELSQAARVDQGQRLVFVPLFSICHRDGADMVTVGGAVARTSEVASWQECLRVTPALTDNGINPAFLELNMIPVTVKEKIALDACLPYPLDEGDFLAQARGVGLELDADELRQYRRYYRHFPVFVETPI